MSLYLPDIPLDNRANKTLFGSSMRAIDLVLIKALGAGVISGLTVDNAGNLQIGEAAIGHVVAVTAPISVMTTSSNVVSACAPSALNYVFLQMPPMPSAVPSAGSAAGVVGVDGRDAGQIVVNTSGVAPANAALIATVQTGAGNAVVAVNNAPTGRNNLILPSQIQAQIQALRTRDLFVSGALPVQNGMILWRVPSALTITQLKASIVVAPVGSAQIWDVKRNGVSIFSVSGNRLSIAAGATQGASAVADNAATCAEGDIISIDVTQAGSTSPAAGFAGTLYFKA
ncbi:hypothetical protein CCAX7_54460 [Capsulimonas corticalis]|uniref:Uncharacterized protein n=1 Tax=Capsulimonas corticalis TaxID=2219043 RepID=A0A402D5T4_9BACT|nr:hypothetical protein [Capsulimonas corticalis]BDI33395.1 hypothetical protein CCAX7_54460 [Capsulimonas corticalis]